MRFFFQPAQSPRIIQSIKQSTNPMKHIHLITQTNILNIDPLNFKSKYTILSKNNVDDRCHYQIIQKKSFLPRNRARAFPTTWITPLFKQIFFTHKQPIWNFSTHTTTHYPFHRLLPSHILQNSTLSRMISIGNKQRFLPITTKQSLPSYSSPQIAFSLFVHLPNHWPSAFSTHSSKCNIFILIRSKPK